MSVLQYFGIQPKQFRYTLSVGSTDYVLPNAPIGWEEQELKWSRSETYYGMIRSFTVPLKFVLDVAWILRTQFYTKGLKATTSILIEELVPETWLYETRFSGDVDYSTFSDTLNEVTCTIMEGGMTAQIKSYENIKYTIPLDVADARDVTLTPLKLEETAQWIFTPQESRTVFSIAGLTWLTELYSSQSIGILPVRQVPFTLLSSNPTIPLGSDFTDQNFFEAKIDTDITITGNVKGSIQNTSGSNTYQISIYKSDDTYAATLVSRTLSGSQTVNFDEDISVTIPMLAGERLWIITNLVPGSGTINGILIDEGTLSATYYVGSPATTCKAVTAKYLYTELIKKMNGGVTYPVQSTILDLWDDLVITSGNAIRGLPDPTLITSFKDFFQSMNSVLNVGFGLQNGKAVLEGKSYWFQNIKGADVGDNKSFELEIYEPYMYNSVKYGYKDQQFSTIINAKDEVNSEANASFPILRIQKELNLISEYRADPYGIEDTRITPVDSSNNNNNNDVFMIKVIQPVSGEYQPERTEGYISLTGVLADETYYNYELSPKKNLLRHGDYLHSILDKYDSSAIIFESALKNAAMSVVYLTGERVTENTNISIGTLPDKLFLPYLITILTKLPKNMMNLIDSFPTGYIRSQFLDENQDGYIVDVSVDISKNRERELKLLLTPSSDVLKLIH